MTLHSGGAQLIMSSMLTANIRVDWTPVSDWWTAFGLITRSKVVAAYLAKGAATLAESYTNLADPGVYTLTTSQAPTLVSGGWDFDSVGDNLISAVPVEATWTVITRFTLDTGGESSAGRLFSACTERFMVIPRNGGVNKAFFNGTVGAAFTPAVDIGVDTTLTIAGLSAYQDTTLLGSITSGALGATNFIIGNRADSARTFDGRIAAMVIANATLSAGEVAALHTAMMSK